MIRVDQLRLPTDWLGPQCRTCKHTQPSRTSPPETQQDSTLQADSLTVLLGMPFQRVLSNDCNLHPSKSKQSSWNSW